jgi:hypothetical protein
LLQCQNAADRALFKKRMLGAQTQSRQPSEHLVRAWAFPAPLWYRWPFGAPSRVNLTPNDDDDGGEPEPHHKTDHCAERPVGDVVGPEIGDYQDSSNDPAIQTAPAVALPHVTHRDMDRLGDADVTHVQTLAGSYKTSLEATANRYAELTPDSCAFVFSKDGVVRYVRKTEDFPRLAVNAKEPLPSDCSSRRAPAQPLRVATGWDEVDSEVWLHEPKGKARLRSILEQSVRQKGGHQVTLLFMSAEQVSDDEEDEELSDSWQPKFRR